MIPLFRDLIARFPASADLEAFLESEEGGRLRIIDRAEGVCLIRYEKGLSNFDLPHVPWFRSVTWDTVRNRPLAIAPPRKQSHLDGDLIYQPLLDGVMVNMYVRGDTWGMSTRSRLGASGYFYSSKPFSQLFLEALQGFSTLDEFAASLRTDGTVCYSFLLQHTESRNVTPITENAVYVIHRAVIDAEGGVAWEDVPVPPCGTRAVEPLPPPVLSWVDQGRVGRDGQGGRVVERRPEWVHVKMLRGNDASDLARFLRLYHGRVLAEYVGYYPEEEPYMLHHSMWMHTLTRQLFHLYRDVHVRRVVKTVDPMWRPHLHELQRKYLAMRVPLTLVDVAEYLRLAPWHRVAHLIRRLQADF